MGSQSDIFFKTGLLLGFVALGAGTTTAYLDPATQFELSIYSGTPMSFWIFCSFALLVSILVAFSASGRRVRALGAILGGVTMTTIVSLQIVRGYYYVGETDALSHLGIASDISSGVIAATESRYPVVHSLGVALHDVTSLELRHALMLLIVVFVVCFFIFVPIVTRELVDYSWATYLGLYSGFLLLPINHLAPSQRIHPTSQALMFAPAFLFAFVLLYRRRTVRNSALFLLIAPMYVLLHLQQAANLVAFFGVIAVAQIGYDVLQGHWSHRIREWMLPEVSAYATMFFLWALTLPIFHQNFEQAYETLFGDTNFAASTASRTGSLAAIGGSLPEVFVKLFLVSLVYVILTGYLLILLVRSLEKPLSVVSGDRLTTDGGTHRILLLSIYGGLIPVSIVFLLYLAGGISDQYFRHLGMLMVLATILGAIAIGWVMRYLSRNWSSSTARRVIVVVFVIFTALSLPVVFTSPYIYDYSNHVTEKQVDGYETTFDHRAESIVFADVRSKVYRYGHALERSTLPEDTFYGERPYGVPDHFCNRSLRSYYDEPVYIPVTEADRTRDPVLWDGFRFSHEDFDYLQTEPQINKVQVNEGYALYLLEPNGKELKEGQQNGC